MGLDHSLAFVSVFFDGLIGFCICRREDYRCEMGMVPAPDHEPLLSIERISTDGSIKWILKDQGLGPEDDVSIVADHPVREGVSKFEGTTWDPVGDLGDPEDFRWVMDLQGGRFHEEHLRLKQGTGATFLRPRITVPHAILYTKLKTQVPFRRFRRPDRLPKVPIGKIADIIGADIQCNFHEKQKKVDVTIGTQTPYPLLFKTEEGDGFHYNIYITNLCRKSGTPRCPPGQSDFPHYYKVATDADGIEFDLEPIYPPGHPKGKDLITDFGPDNFPELQGFFSDGPPEICSVAFFGRANSIP